MVLNKRKLTTKPMLLSAVALLILIGIAISYKILSHNDITKIGQATTADGKEVNLKPPTKDEKQSADANKEAIIQNNAKTNSTPSTSTQKKQVSVVISDFSSSGVRAYASGVFEDGGTCTATAAQGSHSITKSSTGFQNVSYTQCEPIEWNSPLANGVWSITVTYKSATAEGTQTKTIEIQ